MNRRRMILLAVAVTTLGLTRSAKAYKMERIAPDNPLDVPAGAVGGQFGAFFSDLKWPYYWHLAEWHVDDQVVGTTNLDISRSS